MNKLWLIGIGVLVLVLVGYVSFSRSNAVYPSQRSSTIPTSPSVSKAPSQPSATNAIVQEQKISLTVTSPSSGTTVYSSSLAVKGKTVPRASVNVNDKETVADGSGNFSATITLDEGENSIMVVAYDADGKSAEQELTVTYDAAQ